MNVSGCLSVPDFELMNIGSTIYLVSSNRGLQGSIGTVSRPCIEGTQLLVFHRLMVVLIRCGLNQSKQLDVCGDWRVKRRK
jgi:hypothetical protein